MGPTLFTVDHAREGQSDEKDYSNQYFSSILWEVIILSTDFPKKKKKIELILMSISDCSAFGLARQILHSKCLFFGPQPVFLA